MVFFAFALLLNSPFEGIEDRYLRDLTIASLIFIWSDVIVMLLIKPDSKKSDLKKSLENKKDVYINSNEFCIPHILNISVKGIKAETFMHALEEYDVYVSTKTACSDEDSYSESVYDLTNDMDLAKSSIRISLSHLTTNEEIEKFIEIFNNCYEKLKKVVE